jgi:DNA primase
MALGITDAVLDEIKARLDIADVISSYGVNVRAAGSGKVACCPFHNEKTPSFHINSGRGFYHCFGCGESGDVIKFVQKMDGLTFVEAVKKLADECSVTIETVEDKNAVRRSRLYALMAELALFYSRCLKLTREAQLARDYLDQRDLDENTRESFLIGYAPNGAAPILKWAEKYGYSADELYEAGVIKPPERQGDIGYHRFGGRLVFSVRDKQGRVVAFSARQLVANKKSGKYVNSPETPIFRKSSVLFGFDKAAGNIAKSAHHEAIVCEGQIDTIRLHICGFPVAVASQGTAFTEEHVSQLKRVAEQVTLVFDDDAAGHKATVRTARLFLAAGMPVKVVALASGDDPDSFLRKHPREDFAKLLAAAESIISFQSRIERALEPVPDSIDALSRRSKSLLATVAASGSAVIKASMLAEAASCLSLPIAALSEELEKLAAAPKRREKKGNAVAADDDYIYGVEPPQDDQEGMCGVQSARDVVPPSELEFAFCAFLMENERDAELDKVVGEFLPDRVFAHPFTVKYVKAWRTEIASEDDMFAILSEGLPPLEKGWLERIFADAAAGRSRLSAESEIHILQDFVRRLWSEHLKRLRGELPASSAGDIEAQRFEISYNIRKFRDLGWGRVKELIREITKGEN